MHMKHLTQLGMLFFLLLCQAFSACEYSIRSQKVELAKKILENARDSSRLAAPVHAPDSQFLKNLELVIAKEEKHQ